jgi:3-oxoacyl-[acyl-carrier-protein] synthase III
MNNDKKTAMVAKPVALEILGTGEYVPSRRITSTYFDEHWNKPTGWTFEQTGIDSRAHAEPGETSVSMAAAAARDALRAAGLDAADLDAVISVSSVGHQAIPCTAVLVHRELGLDRSGVPAFDINSTCTGFLTALDLIAQSIATGRVRHALIVAGEVASRGLNWDDTATAALFGDGAGAVVIGASRSPQSALRGFLMRTYSAGSQLCQLRAGGTGLSPRAEPDEFLDGTYFEMSGRSIYRMAATLLPDFLRDLMVTADSRPDEVDVWVPHQASGKAIAHLQEALGLPADKMVRTLATHGNQVAASIPIALHRGITSGRIQRGNRVGIIGTGAGISLGGAVLQF